MIDDGIERIGYRPREVTKKVHFLRCSWELNNFLLSAVSSALDLPMGPFGWVHNIGFE